MKEKGIFGILLEFISNRIIILSVLLTLTFSYIVFRLFDIQIVNGHIYRAEARLSISEETDIEAPRGAIYDKFGKPLAINTVAFSVKIDVTVNVEDKNQSVLELIRILDENNEQIIDEMPITKEKPYAFMFDGSEKREERWKKDMGMEDEELLYSAEESYRFLCEKAFRIPIGLDPVTERKLVSIRQSLALNRYNFNQVTIARDVKDKTIAMIEEQKHKFPGAVIEVEPLRIYPEGELFAHIVGYIRSITSEQFQEYEQYGYTERDIVGQLGVEKAMELSLKGTNGKKSIETDQIGRVISTEITSAAVPGDKVFLTIDAEFQERCALILRNSLRDTILNKLDGRVPNSFTVKELCQSMVQTNKKIVEAAYKSVSEEETPELIKIKNAFINDVEEFSVNNEEKLKAAKSLVAEAIESNKLSSKTIVLALFEMGMLTDTEDYVNLIKSGRKTPSAVIREKLQSDELEPSDTGADPCTGGIAVTDVKTGAVIALVTYPSYDNNEFVNGFNSEYYYELLFDEQFPFTNRPLLTRKAPGSTFKMLSAIAVLQEEIVTPTSTVTDYGIFTKAGIPHARCWISPQGGTHGPVNVTTAIEVSCNYFFYETAFRLGNQTLGSTAAGIATLGKYMEHFGLTGYTGIEIEETMPRYASSEYKENLEKAINPNAASYETRWNDGDTIRAAIGQSNNSFTPANMAKYIATLANGGTRFKTHLIGKTEGFHGNNQSETEPVIESVLDIKPENLEAVFKGMLAVTSGARGTARHIFTDLPIKVAGKTGTAEEAKNRASHTWFVAFAPYEAPEIALAVMLPFGESQPSPSAVIAKEIVAEYFDLNRTHDENNYVSSISK